MGVLVFVIVAATLAVVAHLFIRRFVLAVLLSSMGSSVLFQLIVWIQLGYLDPFAPIAFIVTLVLAVLISAMVGALFSVMRTKPQD